MDANTKSLLESLKNAIEVQDKRQMGYLLAKLQDTSEFAVLLPFIQNGNEYQALGFIESWLDDELNASLDKLIEWADENVISADKFPRDKKLLLNLKGLDLSNCGLKTLPDEFANLQRLERLNLWSNNFQKFPKVICALKSLKELDLHSCKLSSLPDEFANLQSLEKLRLCCNNFQEFPKVINSLKNLTQRDITEADLVNFLGTFY